MECPVSMEKMTVPRVLPCGHTFDEKSLMRTCRRCPLCRRPFACKVKDLPINWILTDLDPKVYYEMICFITKDEQDRIARTNLEEITWDIVRLAEKGRCCTRISEDDIFGCSARSMRSTIFYMVSDALRRMGFLVKQAFDISCWGRSTLYAIVSWSP